MCYRVSENSASSTRNMSKSKQGLFVIACEGRLRWILRHFVLGVRVWLSLRYNPTPRALSVLYFISSLASPILLA